MARERKPVVLDPWQNIIEVGWPGFDFCAQAFSVQFEWFAQDTVTEAGPQPKDWAVGDTCIVPAREVVEPQGPMGPGVIVAHYLTGLRKTISFGTDVKLRRKRKQRNEETGALETVVEWVQAQPSSGPFIEQFGYPKPLTFSAWAWVGTTTPDSVSAAPAFEIFLRETEGTDVRDRFGEVVTIEGTEDDSTFANTFQEGIPYVNDGNFKTYLWGWKLDGTPLCTKFTAGSTVNTLQAAGITGQEEFSPETINLGGCEILAGNLKFRQCGIGIDWDENLSILYERVPNTDEPPEEEETE